MKNGKGGVLSVANGEGAPSSQGQWAPFPPPLIPLILKKRAEFYYLALVYRGTTKKIYNSLFF